MKLHALGVRHLGPHDWRERRACRRTRPRPMNVDHVLERHESADVSRSSGRPCVFGYISDGRYIVVIYQAVGHRHSYSRDGL